MKLKTTVWKLLLLCAAILFLGCKDDVEDASAASSLPTQSDCASPCSKAVSCGLFSSMNACNTECVETFTSAEVSCIANCGSSLECNAWETCAEDCISWEEPTISQGNGVYCEGYVMGEDIDECCQTNDPCDWGSDSFCDCLGTCSWDAGDCAE